MRGINFLDWLYPPKCMICNGIIDINGEKWLCPSCTGSLEEAAGGAVCDKCGRPLEESELKREENTVICAECRSRAASLRFERNRPAFVYDDVMKSLIHKFKYGRHPSYGRGLGALMAARLGASCFGRVDIVVPVPLHRAKLRLRGYNQSGLLAAELARRYKKPYRSDALVRTRATTPQAALSPRERVSNIAGAFAVNARRAAELKDKRVLLVDDIYTTGSTLSECAGVLLAAGARAVECVTLAVALKKDG